MSGLFFARVLRLGVVWWPVLAFRAKAICEQSRITMTFWPSDESTD